MSKSYIPTPSEPAGPNECQIMIYNVQKSQNIGNIVRSAVAFGATTCVVVGDRKIPTFGNQGTNGYLQFDNYPDGTTACDALKARGFEIIGVEIGENSISVNADPFTGPTVFMFGNEGSGLSEKQKKLCDKLVYIPQFGKGTASLNVSNSAAIMLHRYATWAGYKQQVIVGEKFLVDEEAKIQKTRKNDQGEYIYSENDEKLKIERALKKQKTQDHAQDAQDPVQKQDE